MDTRHIHHTPSFVVGIGILMIIWSASAQYSEDFDNSDLSGYHLNSGDGNVDLKLLHSAEGYATFRVDARNDTWNIYWAVLEKSVSGPLDLHLLTDPRHELRVESRVRVSKAPRRFNFRFQTQRTTDYHINLMEFDLAEPNTWYTVSFSTRGFDGKPGDNIVLSTAVIDAGMDIVDLEFDYVRVDVVNIDTLGPELGAHCPYHPPIPELSTFSHTLVPAHDVTIDTAESGANYSTLTTPDGQPAISLDDTRSIILRWDFSELGSPIATTSAVLELTTHSSSHVRNGSLPELGQCRFVEIADAETDWEENAVSAGAILGGKPFADVFNPQMIIDQFAKTDMGSKNYLTISRVVLQRLIDGKTKGLAIQPLGTVQATFYSAEHDNVDYRPKLYVNLSNATRSIPARMRILRDNSAEASPICRDDSPVGIFDLRGRFIAALSSAGSASDARAALPQTARGNSFSRGIFVLREQPTTGHNHSVMRIWR